MQFSEFDMELDLNSLLLKIYSWKNILKEKEDENKKLLIKNKEHKLCIETLEASNKQLLLEINLLNKYTSSLQLHLSEFETKNDIENKMQNEKIDSLKLAMSKQEKMYQEEILELKMLIEKQQNINEKEVEKKVSEATSKLRVFSDNLIEKENRIIELENEISNLKNENCQEILRLKIENEEKLTRLKRKMVKNKGSNHHQDFKSNDIFRQKFVEKEREAREESLKLKSEIDELKREILLLKSKTVQVPRQNGSLSECHSFSNIEFHSFEEINPSKKQKRNEIFPDDDFVQVHPTNISRNKQSVLCKKKLFNIDTNYFDK